MKLKKCFSVSELPFRILSFHLCRVSGTRGLKLMTFKLKNFMEQLNKIELRGVVGSVKIQSFADNRMARFTLATNYAYKDREGCAVIDTSWHTVIAWENKNITELNRLERGSKVYVQGRLRYQKYTGSDGVEKVLTEVIANRLIILDEPDPLQYEM